MKTSNADELTFQALSPGPAGRTDPEVHARVDVETRVRAALLNLRLRDKKLLEYEVHEFTICGRLAMYLQCLFSTYDVDIDYNRDGSQIKALYGKHVRPDIIVHKRGHNRSNLLAIELKKSPVSEEDQHQDRVKLAGYRANLKYRSAMRIELPVGHAADNMPTMEWVEAADS